MSEWNAGDFVRDLLKSPTQRDKQVRVGASNLSNGCARCLAENLLDGSSDNAESPYWLAPVIGTAVHALVENRGHNEEVLRSLGVAPDEWLTEFRVTLGTIPGYGVVKSTSDGFHIPSGTVVDLKTTDRDKLGFIKRAILDPPSDYEVTKVAEARFKVANYFRQTQLYGLGVENAGYNPRACALVFICRDGKLDKDIWPYTIPYDREEALRVLDRGAKLWGWLQEEGHTPDDLASAEYCYRCSRREDR